MARVESAAGASVAVTVEAKDSVELVAAGSTVEDLVGRGGILVTVERQVDHVVPEEAVVADNQKAGLSCRQIIDCVPHRNSNEYGTAC